MAHRAGIITQVRMTSTRLPGKVLLPLGDATMLRHHINRLQWAGIPIVIATTTNKEDDPVCEMAASLKIPFYRGSENDVLSRFLHAAEENKLDTVIRVTSDCPLIDGHVIKSALDQHLAENNEFLYTSNVIERTFPRGLDFEIFSFKRLKTANENATEAFQREHVTPFLNRNTDGKTEFLHIHNNKDRSEWRLTVDTTADLSLIKTLIEKFHSEKMAYAELGQLLDANPELAKINSHIEQKKI